MSYSIPIYKIVVLGEGRVGKTSMTLKYVKNEFNNDQESSINACYLQKDIQLSNRQLARLSIWDTAGQEKYNAVAPVYYRDAIGAIVVYEIVSIESLDRAKKWVHELRENANHKDIVIVLAGNKADMEVQRRVPVGEAEKYAKENGISHFLVSAKNGTNLNELFAKLAEEIYQVMKKHPTGIVGDGSKRNPRIKIQSQKHSEKPKQKGGCC